MKQAFIKCTPSNCGYDSWLDQGDPANDRSRDRIEQIRESIESELGCANLALDSVDGNIYDFPEALTGKILAVVEDYLRNNNPDWYDDYLENLAKKSIERADIY